eukprot:9325466-Heterocapsa_arctica.AAC.1
MKPTAAGIALATEILLLSKSKSNIDIEIKHLHVRGYRAIGESSRHRRSMRNETLIIFNK